MRLTRRRSGATRFLGLSRDPRALATRRATSFVAVLGGLAGLASLFNAIAVLRGRSWGEGAPLAIADLPQVIAAVPGPHNSLTAVDLPFVVRLASALPGLAHGVVIVAATYLVLSVLREIASGRAFSARARLALARTSLVLIIGSLVCTALDGLAVWQVEAIMRAPLDPDLAPWWESQGVNLPSVPLFLLALGVLSAAVMYAFRDGATLVREAEGVV